MRSRTNEMDGRLPAPLSLLDRVTLELQLLTCSERVHRLRQQVAALELEQQELRVLIHGRLSSLQREAECLRAEVQTLEGRLHRLLRVTRPMSDEELDAAMREDAQRGGWREEWQDNRANSRLAHEVMSNGHDDDLLKRLYRTLARLLHPDLAQDDEERLQREQMMRFVNQARERRDIEQLQRLLAVWSKTEEIECTGDLESLRRALAQRELEELQLRRRLQELERWDLWRLARKGMAAVEQYVQKQEELLRHEIATLRLRRRRLLRLIEERRRELAQRATVS